MGMPPSEDNSGPRQAGVGQSHQMFSPRPLEETTRLEVERRREWAELPGNADYEQLRREAAEARRRRKQAGKPEGFIGPPNPYKPHRKR